MGCTLQLKTTLGSLNDVATKILQYGYMFGKQAMVDMHNILAILHDTGDADQKLKCEAFKSNLWKNYSMCGSITGEEHLALADFRLFNQQREHFGLPQVTEATFKLFAMGRYFHRQRIAALTELYDETSSPAQVNLVKKYV